MSDILDLYQGIFDVCAIHESELTEQVKVLQEALKEAVGLAMEIVMKENALEESALEQAKPKGEMEAKL